MRASTARTFQAYVISLNLVMSLKYLGHIMTELYDDWTELVSNLHNSKNSLALLLIILLREGETQGSRGCSLTEYKDNLWNKSSI